MKTISIRELHTRTGHYVRSAQTDPLVVTERGKVIATLQPIKAGQVTFHPFPRRTLKELVSVKSNGVDSTKMISEDRDRQ